MNLKDAAKEAGLSGADIARKMGVTEATVSRWLSRRDAVSPKYIKKLAKLLRVDLAEVLPPD